METIQVSSHAEMVSTYEIRQILSEHGRLSADPLAVDTDADLYSCGLTSHASVNIMLALEDHFDIEFPDRMLRRRTFESIDAIHAAVTELLTEKAAS